ncbi:AHH domain-containing protein [Pyxidicoccus fallax]|uniref:Uncharacterized protein n=1 Tax=Pyxidicoccus fallax TaxID=394095 RepID=A0A848LEQ4_9BACT|nr:AHH domain-containing protein [Pyxidicoccus fallax]NMO13968.1 hypothetical protein [Pyxidicoccus fallax]NPC76700.1 AHH domain-containing protein [Pyxidicoccus fallax]
MSSSGKSARKLERKSKVRSSSPPDDGEFPELKAGYPDSFIQEKADSNSFHMDVTQPENSVLTSGKYYAYRGPRFIFQDEPRKKIYNDFNRSIFSKMSVIYYRGRAFRGGKPPLYVTASREKWMQVVMFPEAGGRFPGEQGNFYYLSPQGQRFPYPWQAHHLIPQSVFFDKNTPFNEDQMMVLKRSFYDINNGHNIIMLPADPKYSPVHKLLVHFSDHPAYTSHIQSRMDEVSAELDKIFKKAKKEKKHLAPFKAILKALHVLEDEFWSLVILMSNAAAAAVLNDQEEEATQAYGDMLRFWTTNKLGQRIRHLFGILR